MSKVLDLQLMEKAAKEAMQGPFFVCDRSIHGCDVEDKNGSHVAFFHAKCNADFFAAVTPKHVLAMIDTIRELRAEVERLKPYAPVGNEFDWVNGDD